MKTQFFLALRDLVVCMKQKYFFLFWKKPGILIPDLYLYGMKIQTNIKQNSVEKYVGKSQIFEKKIEFFLEWAGPDAVILGWAGVVQPKKQNMTVERLSTVHIEREQWRVN